MKKEMMNKIFEKLDIIARDYSPFEYGLPFHDEGQRALMREAITEIIEEEKTDE